MVKLQRNNGIGYPNNSNMFFYMNLWLLDAFLKYYSADKNKLMASAASAGASNGMA